MDRHAVVDFFDRLWSLAIDKHQQGAYNTACLAVLLALPLVVLLTSLVVCCHCCCCRRRGDGDGRRCCCCRRRGAMATAGRSETKKKKKKKAENSDDLWISVKAGPMTPDRVALAME